MSNVNSLQRGAFNLHRTDVGATDSPPLALSERAGINTASYKGVAISIVLESGALTSFTAELLYWDPVAGEFVSAISTADSVTSTKPGQWKVTDTGDRTVYVAITALSGTAPKLGIYVQPIPREGQYDS